MQEFWLGGAVIAILAGAVIGILYAFIGSGDDEDTKAFGEKVQACRADPNCIGPHLVQSHGPGCRDAIARLAKDDAKWEQQPDQVLLGYYSWRDKKAGIISLIGDQVQFRDGFGGYVNMAYRCDFDVSANAPKLIFVAAMEGAL